MSVADLRHTPLHDLHVELGAKMVPFAGYAMPVNYPDGILAEHRQCRAVGRAVRRLAHGPAAPERRRRGARARDAGAGGRGRPRRCTSSATPSSPTAQGGILDDLMITRRESDLLLIVNAACKEADTQHLITQIGQRCSVVPMPERALLALQGPKAVNVLSRLNAEVAKLTFMTGGAFRLAGVDCFVTRSGYTGEDGFEISVPADDGGGARQDACCASPRSSPPGSARATRLRLEAGLCLYGHDIDDKTTPIEAGLTWAIQKVRRPGGARAGHYPGAAAIEAQLAAGTAIKRVGLVGLERMPVREGATIVDAHGHQLGHVTSGTIGPTVDQPIAMAYLAANHALPHHEVYAEVRGKRYPMRVSAMPFAPHRYYRG